MFYLSIELLNSQMTSLSQFVMPFSQHRESGFFLASKMKVVQRKSILLKKKSLFSFTDAFVFVMAFFSMLIKNSLIAFLNDTFGSLHYICHTSHFSSFFFHFCTLFLKNNFECFTEYTYTFTECPMPCVFQVAHMTKSEIDLWDTSFIGPGLLVVNQYFDCILNEYLVLWICLVSHN